MNGFILVNKPVSWSSFDIVKLIKKTTGIKKVGHTGTLDREASGLLIVCMGKATRSVEDFMLMEKEYEVEGKLGETTDTDDASGRVVERKRVDKISHNTLKKIVNGFAGEIYQVPPMYSAIKVKGERLYKIARSGKTAKRNPRRVLLKRIDILSLSPPFFKLKVVCGKGFYVRALIRDIGEKLRVGAHTECLIRTRIGNYILRDSLNVEDLRDKSKIFSRVMQSDNS